MITRQKFYISLLIIGLFIVVIPLYALVGRLPHYKVEEIRQINMPVGLVSDGEKIVKAMCVHCHLTPGTNSLAGRQYPGPEKLGTVYAPNLTRDTVYGIGGWSDEELTAFLRTGVKPDGRFAAFMPVFPTMSDADIVSIIVFLRSGHPLVAPVNRSLPPNRYSWLSKIYLQYIAKPYALPEEHIPHPDTTDAVAYGKYLTDSRYECFNCHSRHTVTNDRLEPHDSWGYLAGCNPQVNEQGEKIITPGLGNVKNWRFTQFERLMRKGALPSGRQARDPMFQYDMLSDNELNALYTYFQTLEDKHAPLCFCKNDE